MPGGEAGRDQDAHGDEAMRSRRPRCGGCGNLTRFDVVETRRTRSYHHYSLGGDLIVEEQEVLDSAVESVTCRWCGSSDRIEWLPVGGA